MKNLLRNVTASAFNRRYPVGSRFIYHPIPGMPEREEVVTRSAAWHLHKGRLVVRVEGKIGGISVSRLEPLE
ncbi:hypothetical protein AAIG33_01215 [Phytobacter ursingii]|uniref:hypothetical protein n=1 Tax=Phytobacter ursingii TaxID=1972431 RepID=UPI0031B7DF40